MWYYLLHYSQTELEHLFSDISESKFHILQKLAGILDCPPDKQLEVKNKKNPLLFIYIDKKKCY